MAKKAYIGVGGIAKKVKKGYVGVPNFAPRDLPSGYTQVEYIESTGTQWIDTGFVANQDSRVVMDVSELPITDATCYAFGGRTSSNSNPFAFAVVKGSAYRSDYNGKQASFASGVNYTGRFTIDKNKNVTTLNNNESVTGTYATFTSAYSIGLFAMNTAGTASNLAQYRMYNCQIYDNGVMVRDYVPCINSSGVAGLYDLANGVFYQNAGTGIFATGETYGSIARKIKKAYIGIGGVARPCWSGGELAYYGMIDSLTTARNEVGATTVGDYALFAGGRGGEYSTRQTEVNAYNSSLTKSTPTALSKSRNGIGATTIGNYALFAGGHTGSGVYGTNVDAYDSSLTRSTATSLSLARSDMGAATVGDYAIFAGGDTEDDQVSTVDAYNRSLTRSKPTSLSQSRYDIGATTVGNYALFAGGYRYSASAVSSTVDAYDTSLTRSTPTGLNYAKRLIGATTVGDYAIFAGGQDAGNFVGQSSVDAYNSSLTKVSISSLNQARYNIGAATIGNYAIFVGGDGNGNVSYGTVEVYDASLTRTKLADVGAVGGLAATTVGNYALFGGGYNNNNDTYNSTVLAYTVA